MGKSRIGSGLRGFLSRRVRRFHLLGNDCRHVSIAPRSLSRPAAGCKASRMAPSSIFMDSRAGPSGSNRSELLDDICRREVMLDQLGNHALAGNQVGHGHMRHLHHTSGDSIRQPARRGRPQQRDCRSARLRRSQFRWPPPRRARGKAWPGRRRPDGREARRRGSRPSASRLRAGLRRAWAQGESGTRRFPRDWRWRGSGAIRLHAASSISGRLLRSL